VTRGATRVRLAAAFGVAFVAAGCAVSVQGELDEQRANRAVALLSASGIAAEKAADATEPGRFRVVVASDDAARAVGILVDEGQSAHDAPGVLDALGTGSLVPSPDAEHERVLAGVAGDLTRSLEGIDGVLSARVHLAAARPDPLAVEGVALPPTAAVLIRYRGASPPIREDDVQKLVAHAVPGLTVEHVAVVYSVAAPARLAPSLVKLGPLSTTRTTARKVRLAVLLVLLVNIALAAGVLSLWSRLRRFRASAPEEPKPKVVR
jgi:type III secretion protein J